MRLMEEEEEKNKNTLGLIMKRKLDDKSSNYLFV